MLAQGGEFAFVLLSLASELKVLPEELNKLLIIVVVISMALTPGLASVGRYLADRTPDESNPAGPFLPHPLVPCVCHLKQWLEDGLVSCAPCRTMCDCPCALRCLVWSGKP